MNIPEAEKRRRSSEDAPSGTENPKAGLKRILYSVTVRHAFSEQSREKLSLTKREHISGANIPVIAVYL